tara:strand:+ start:7318 stop:8208 length:891 start_codon:yes stop_codon:yes gene_type:complete
LIVIETYIVTEEMSNVRLIDCAFEVFEKILTKSSLKKFIKKGLILIDDKNAKSGDRLAVGMIVKLIDKEESPPKPLDFKLDIIFQDEHIAVINKPAGIEVSGNKYFTIQNALVANIKISKEIDALKWARPVHRLDYPTSGLLIVAKTKSALSNIGKQFENRTIRKKYRALLAGRLKKRGSINTAIANQNALTKYEVINYSRSLKTEWITEANLYPHSGRRHQLRIHMSNIGHPVVGDKNYGDGPILKGKGLFLSATDIELSHPKTGELILFSIEPPKKFKSFLMAQQKNWDKNNGS